MAATQRNRVKMADVARESGVSLSTVSLVLSDKPGLPPETRMRVLDAARSLGYRLKPANALTSGLLLKTIGLIVKAQPEDVPQSNEFYSHVLAGIEAACRQLNLNLLFATMPVDIDNRPVQIPQLLQKGTADGLLLVGAFLDETLIHVLGERPTPVVLVDGYSDNNQYDAVVSGNFEGAYQATCYLLEKGHRHIGFVGGHNQAYPSNLDRRRGYRHALMDHQIPDEYFADCRVHIQDASQAAAALIKNNPQITAIVGCNDEAAIGSLRALIEMDCHVPGDISIIGYGDINLAANVNPPLTTMQVDKVQMGRLAVQLLINRALLPEAGLVTAVVRPRLVERMSVRMIYS